MQQITKDQERAALAKIRAIVEPLGEDSYIGTAFKGVLADADQNIEYDFGCSQYDRAESALEDAATLRAAVEEARERAKRLSETLTAKENNLDNVRQGAEALNRLLTEQREKTDTAERRATEAELLVTQLKAKLYDLLIK